MRRSAYRDWADRHVVYRYFDRDGQLLYVGCTKNVVRRDWEHRSGGTGAWWYPLVTRTRVRVFPTAEAAAASEAEAIRTEAPIYNCKGTERTSQDLISTPAERRLYQRYRSRPGNYTGWWLA